MIMRFNEWFEKNLTQLAPSANRFLERVEKIINWYEKLSFKILLFILAGFFACFLGYGLS